VSDERIEQRPSEVEEELDRRTRDTHVAAWVFFIVGNAVGTMSLIYLLTDDDAGQMMLGVASLLGLWCAAFLWLKRPLHRAVDEDPDAVQGAATTDEPMYLPHASIWPFSRSAASISESGVPARAVRTSSVGS